MRCASKTLTFSAPTVVAAIHLVIVGIYDLLAHPKLKHTHKNHLSKYLFSWADLPLSTLLCHNTILSFFSPVTLFTRQQIGLEYLFIVIETWHCRCRMLSAFVRVYLRGVWGWFYFSRIFRFSDANHRLGQLEMEINSANRYYIITLDLFVWFFLFGSQHMSLVKAAAQFKQNPSTSSWKIPT